ncbi:MAG: TIM barrel protein [Candidatus Aenigmarchaeota archaeon]|nr:TIM barrel protein [Candidatus Aenigmarchaeota archaeon]NIP40686.1 TIM barrel protein [Candidatus Aenigmarchaeota archaeon]NIQ18492.1 TIM barrel protein [Candidatus Aenigmarchaeota archaeon]NIS73391.1 TIM barrel protein [Candidatus Aenigmarchaeota archaeon]
MRIYLGPAGSPARSTLEGVAKVKELGLHCMEVQFTHGIKMGLDLAKEIGKERERVGIELSVHAPYYINLASKDPKKIKESEQRILDSCERAHHMGAKNVVFHPAYFGGKDRESIYKIAKEHILDMMGTVENRKWDVLISPETTGKHSALGSLEETIRLSKETGCSLCVDFAHLFARNYGRMDFSGIFEKLRTLRKKHLHSHFSGIEYTAKGEKNHLNMDHSPDFRKFAKVLFKQKWLDSITIISESPITWKDSLKMKDSLAKLGYRWKE